MRFLLRREWILDDHFGPEGLGGLSKKINEWYRRELEGDYRQHCIIRLTMYNEHEVIVEHLVPKTMETGDPLDLQSWLFDRNLQQPVYASFKFTPTEPPPFGMVIIDEDT